MAAAGASTLLPAGALGSLVTGCAGAPTPPSWDFDAPVDRSGTWSIKHGRAGDGQLAMWIADMDFRTAP